MKSILFIISICLFSKYSEAQNTDSVLQITGRQPQKMFQNYKREILPLSLVFLAGAVDGLNQVIAYQYPSFKKAFPNASNQFWSKEISFKNKYKNGDPAQGERFPGSKGILVFLTDGYHMTRFSEHLFLSGALAFKITGQKQKWYYYLIEAASYWLINRAGFVLIYNQFK
jgi:hypothetical protein